MKPAETVSAVATVAVTAVVMVAEATVAEATEVAMVGVEMVEEAMGVVTAEEAMVEAGTEAAREVAEMAAAVTAAVTAAVMVVEAMEEATEVCPRPHLHNSAPPTSRTTRGNRISYGCCPMPQRAAPQDGHEHTPPTPTRADHPDRSR